MIKTGFKEIILSQPLSDGNHFIKIDEKVGYNFLNFTCTFRHFNMFATCGFGKTLMVCVAYLFYNWGRQRKYKITCTIRYCLRILLLFLREIID